MPALSVLMVEDETAVIDVVRDYIAGHVSDVDFRGHSNWKDAATVLAEFRPDVLILDWFDGPGGTGQPAGNTLWSSIWAGWFCPVIIYSARPDEFQDQIPADHPFIKVVPKGADSEQTVTQHLEDFSEHVSAIHGVRDELGNVMISVLRDVAKHVFAAESDTKQRKEMLVRVARRRVAALMDDSMIGSTEPMHSWEQYIHPPYTKHLIVGDILRVTASDAGDCQGYRLILTPTCDLAHSKCGAVLAAKSCDAREFVTRGLNLSAATAEAKLKKGISDAINDFHRSGLAVLPEYLGVLPMVAIDFRQLELIPMEDIGSTEDAKRFTRVASIDSPFREFVAWAFLQINCRPGIPPRNMDIVVDTLVKLVKQTNATEGAK